MEAQPLRSISGSGRCSVEMSSENKEYWTVKMESPVEESEPSVKLGLGIGDHCSARNPVNSSSSSSSSISISYQSRKLESEFTRAQLGELYHQSLIYKYLAAGLPVPLQLVLPFCNGGYYEPYSGCLRVAAFDDRNMMDPEPSRCRRTDGKKWRCRKTVVPNQKYCEGHMHRGRQRSRKPVEISKNFPTEIASRISVADSGNSKGNNCIPSALPLMMSPASNSCSSNRGINANDTTMTNNHVNGKHKTEATVTCAIGSVSSNKRAMVSNATDTTITNNYAGGKNNTEATVTSALATASTTLNSTMNGGRASDSVSDSGKINRSIAVEEKQKIHWSSISKSGNLRSGPIVTLGCSPKSVLQAAAGCGSGSNSNLFIHKTQVGLEPWRCRRTDGKRWRCSRDVLPDQKYCARHINRGVRKQPEMVVTSSNPINLNTNLSISITADIQNERKSSTSRSGSSSDTTLTDSAVAPHEYHSNAYS